MGRPFGTKKIETPERLWELFDEYRKVVKSKPYKVKDWVGKDAIPVQREKEKPLSIDGFEGYLFENEYLADLAQYLSNRDNAYMDYIPIIKAIKREIRIDQVGGGMAGVFNANLTSRLNGLADKTETDVTLKSPLVIDVPNEEDKE